MVYQTTNFVKFMNVNSEEFHQSHLQGQTLAKSNHILSDVMAICFGILLFHCSIVSTYPSLPFFVILLL